MYLDDKPQGSPSREPQVKPLDEPAKLLLKAADIIEERGHCKHARQTERGFCVMGALGMARWGSSSEPNDALIREAGDRLARAVHPQGRYDNCMAVVWNNAPERTKEEVVAKLRAVALGG